LSKKELKKCNVRAADKKNKFGTRRLCVRATGSVRYYLTRSLHRMECGTAWPDCTAGTYGRWHDTCLRLTGRSR